MPKPVTVLVLVGLLLFALRAFLPERIGSFNEPSELLLAKAWYVHALSWASFAGLLPFGAAAIVWLKRRNWGRALAMLGAGVLGFIASWVIFIFLSLIPPTNITICDTIQASDGASYSFVMLGNFEIIKLTLARRCRDTTFFSCFQVLGTTGGNGPSLSWASVIRPAGAENSVSRLVYSDSGWILLGHDEHCSLAYHVPTGKFLGRTDVETLSPFLLMNENTVPNPDDVRRVLNRLQTEPLQLPGQPHERVLREGLTHPNPRVREIAKQMLSIRESRLARATRPSE